MEPISAAIAAGGTLVNGLANAISQKKQNEQNIQLQWDMMRYQNDYNKPINQMQRLKEAGINPHLAYSQGGIQNQSAAPVAQNHAAPQYNFDIQQVLQAKLLDAQIKNMNADTEQKKATTEQTQVTTSISKKELDNYDERFRADIEQTKSQTNINLATYDEKRQNIINLISQNEELQQKIELLKSQKKLTDEDINRVIQLTAVLQAQVELVREQTKTEQVKRSNIEADTRNKNEQTKNLELNNSLLAKFGLVEKLAQIGLTNAQIRMVDANMKKIPLEISNLKKGATLGEYISLIDDVITDLGDFIDDKLGTPKHRRLSTSKPKINSLGK